MPRFTYLAIDHNKKNIKGTVTAENPYAARKHLRSKGLHPTTITEVSASRQGRSLSAVFKKNNKN